MSRIYDSNFLDIPENIPDEDYACRHGIQYKRIEGFPNYFVTDDGYVISFVHEQPIILKTWKNKHGHEYVNLSSRRGCRVKALVHRLVAEAFVPNAGNFPIARHLDDKPYNNCYDNLAWGTAKDNRNDCVKNNHDFRREVYCFENDAYYRSIAEASNVLGIAKSQIVNCCKGKNITANGMHFCYREDVDKRKKDLSWMRPRILKRVIAHGPNGEELFFNSRKEASEAIGIPACGISSVISGKLKHTHHWIFEEGEINECHK